MLFHHSGHEISRAEVSMLFGSNLDVLPEGADNALMIFQQGLYDMLGVSEIVIVLAQPAHRREVFERPQGKMSE